MSKLSTKVCCIIGGGPAGLMAAEVIAEAGISVSVYDQMPTVGRKFLMAGRGGLNLTHSDTSDVFLSRYGASATWIGQLLAHFPPTALKAWSEGLGQPTFVGTSGRVFPKDLKTSPLLRAWLRRLDSLGVKFHTRKRWVGWTSDSEVVFKDVHGELETTAPDALLLALGGASWPSLGSDGAWVKLLSHEKVDLAPLESANSGFIVPWSDFFQTRFAGSYLKPIRVMFDHTDIQGELVITDRGLEGGPLYALGPRLREALRLHGEASITIDLRPGVSLKALIDRLQDRAGNPSLSTHLRRAAGLTPAATGLLNESVGHKNLASLAMEALGHLVKACPVKLSAASSLDRAISTAGGIKESAFDTSGMLKAKPGVFAAGEMLDWEAPTGGYLLQATLSSGVWAGKNVINWLTKRADL